MLNRRTKLISSILVACLFFLTISAITYAEDYTYPKKTKYDGEKCIPLSRQNSMKFKMINSGLILRYLS